MECATVHVIRYTELLRLCVYREHDGGMRKTQRGHASPSEHGP